MNADTHKKNHQQESSARERKKRTSGRKYYGKNSANAFMRICGILRIIYIFVNARKHATTMTFMGAIWMFCHMACANAIKCMYLMCLCRVCVCVCIWLQQIPYIERVFNRFGYSSVLRWCLPNIRTCAENDVWMWHMVRWSSSMCSRHRCVS